MGIGSVWAEVVVGAAGVALGIWLVVRVCDWVDAVGVELKRLERLVKERDKR